MSESSPSRFFALKRPCRDCPFRSDRTPFLHPERAREIADALHSGESFHCHRTLIDGEDGSLDATKDSSHCAGAAIILEHEEQPNQMMRIGERLGMYDRNDLAMGSPVYPCLEDWVAAHG